MSSLAGPKPGRLMRGITSAVVSTPALKWSDPEASSHPGVTKAVIRLNLLKYLNIFIDVPRLLSICPRWKNCLEPPPHPHSLLYQQSSAMSRSPVRVGGSFYFGSLAPGQHAGLAGKNPLPLRPPPSRLPFFPRCALRSTFSFHHTVVISCADFPQPVFFFFCSHLQKTEFRS